MSDPDRYDPAALRCAEAAYQACVTSHGYGMEIWHDVARAVLAEAGRAVPTVGDTVALAWDLLLALEHSMLPLSQRPVEELREERRQLVDRAHAHLSRIEAGEDADGHQH